MPGGHLRDIAGEAGLQRGTTMAQRYTEKGIKDDADYGTQFLNARKDDGGGGGGDEPPRPTPGDGQGGGGRNVGQIVMIAVIVLAVIAGVVAVFALGGGDDGDSGDLIAEGDGVEVGDHERRSTTSTTEEPEPTTTEAPETTTTTTASTTTTSPTSTTASTAPPTSTAPVSCPGGATRTTIGGTYSVLPGQQFRVSIEGTTVNETTAAIDLTLTVAVTHQPTAGSNKVTNVRPEEFGRSIPAGGQLTWHASVIVDSAAEPAPPMATGSWAWSDAALAECPVGTFG
jgi:hypothetical protein